MSLKLTPELIAAAYDYLKVADPFKGWGLPEADDLGFIVSRHKDRYGHMIGYHRSPDADIAMSEKKIGSTTVLITVMAHEMIHLYQHLRGTTTPNTQHNAEFLRLAKRVCKIHVFDYVAFI